MTPLQKCQQAYDNMLPDDYDDSQREKLKAEFKALKTEFKIGNYKATLANHLTDYVSQELMAQIAQSWLDNQDLTKLVESAFELAFESLIDDVEIRSHDDV